MADERWHLRAVVGSEIAGEAVFGKVERLSKTFAGMYFPFAAIQGHRDEGRCDIGVEVVKRSESAFEVRGGGMKLADVDRIAVATSKIASRGAHICPSRNAGLSRARNLLARRCGFIRPCIART